MLLQATSIFRYSALRILVAKDFHSQSMRVATTVSLKPLPLPHRSYADLPSSRSNPVLAEYLKQKPRTATSRSDTQRPQAPEQGSLAPSSIFSAPSNVKPTRTEDGKTIDRNPVSMAARLDPQPAQRRRWERKMVIRAITQRGRLSRAQKIKRTEREQVTKSEFWMTSVKKLGPLARQIAGKSIEDAIVQMNYSKKKVAMAVHNHLIEARNRAIVERGMGLGVAQGNTGKKVTIALKDGTRHRVEDRTGIYVAQAWVGKGSYGQDTDKRARGRIDRLRLPQTSISLLLKEEATRVREHEERVKRAKTKKPWQHLPDRPISAQRPYYCW